MNIPSKDLEIKPTTSICEKYYIPKISKEKTTSMTNEKHITRIPYRHLIIKVDSLTS